MAESSARGSRGVSLRRIEVIPKLVSTSTESPSNAGRPRIGSAALYSCTLRDLSFKSARHASMRFFACSGHSFRDRRPSR